jgi:hypothetical protein
LQRVGGRPGGRCREPARFEAAAGREAYAVATACGLGGHTVEEAEKATEAMAATADVLSA